MDIVCSRRIPEFFIITLMTPDGRALNETRPGQEVANFTISLPQTVDVCTLHVRISAGNSAGTSAPSEAIEVGKLQFITVIIVIICHHYFNLAVGIKFLRLD